MSERTHLAAPQGGGRPAAFDLFCRAFTYAWALILLYPILFIVSLSLRRREELTQAANAGRGGGVPDLVAGSMSEVVAALD